MKHTQRTKIKRVYFIVHYQIFEKTSLQMCSKEKDLQPRFQLHVLAVHKTAIFWYFLQSRSHDTTQVSWVFTASIAGEYVFFVNVQGFKVLAIYVENRAEWRDTGEDIGLYKLHRRTQSHCADPSGRRQTGIQTQCRTQYFAEFPRPSSMYSGFLI